ncbi:unnamed protein product [Paramecium sonneborni]|uniref:Uncharacterized protein n=1 Tax=Paramecium sonneborni TaxID=65129 RepID=A0A8S1RN00_9CILI|nr:unnamed protein product [Paramecium sonneborni]
MFFKFNKIKFKDDLVNDFYFIIISLTYYFNYGAVKTNIQFFNNRLRNYISTKIRRLVGSFVINQTVQNYYLLCHYSIIINILQSGSISKGIVGKQKNNFTKVIITNSQDWPTALNNQFFSLFQDFIKFRSQLYWIFQIYIQVIFSNK